MHKLFLDIETLPADEKDEKKLKMLFEKKHDGFEREKFDEFLARTSFDGAFGRLLCIGYAVDDDPVEYFCNDGDEKKTLQQFWDLVDALSIAPRNPQYPDYGVQFIGHNVMDFDLRFIYQRSIVLGVTLNWMRRFDASIPITITRRPGVSRITRCLSQLRPFRARLVLAVGVALQGSSGQGCFG